MVKDKSLIAVERETICRTSDGDKEWIVTTASPKHIRKLEKLGYQASVVDPVYGYKEFIVRAGGVGFRSAVKKTVSGGTGEALLKARSSRKLIDTPVKSEVNNGS
jgi:hypothetical protein